MSFSVFIRSFFIFMSPHSKFLLLTLHRLMLFIPPYLRVYMKGFKYIRKWAGTI